VFGLTAAQARRGRVHVFNPQASAASPLPSAGRPSPDARTRRPPSVAPTRSLSPSHRRASRTVRS